MKKRALTKKEVQRIENIIQGMKRPYWKRDFAMFRLQLDTALRAGDLMQLKWKDISFNGQVRDDFQVRQGKTGKFVQVQLSQKTIAALQEYLDEERLECLNDIDFKTSYVCYGRRFGRKKPMTVRNWSNIIKEYVFEIGLDPNEISTHSLRKTIPTIMIRNGATVQHCKQILGHKNISNTARYLDISEMEALDFKRKLSI